MSASFGRACRLVVLSAAFSAAACSKRCGGTDSAKKPDAASPDQARVEVSTRGAEPGVTLQVERWAGLRYRITVTNESSFGIEGQSPIKAPTTVAAIRFVVLRGSADPLVQMHDGAEVRLIDEKAVVESLRVLGSDIPKDRLEQFNTALGALVGTSTRELIAEDGEIVEMKTDTVGLAKPSHEISQLLDEAWDIERRFPFRLPAGPVGVGAKWRFTDPVKLRGIRTLRASDVTVVSVDEQKVRFRIRMHFESPRQEIPHPLRPGESAMLDQCRGDGDGEITFDRLTSVVLDAHLATTARLKLSDDTPEGHRQVTLISASVVDAKGVVLGADAGDEDAGEAPPSSAASPSGSAATVPTGSARSP